MGRSSDSFREEIRRGVRKQNRGYTDEQVEEKVEVVEEAAEE